MSKKLCVGLMLAVLFGCNKQPNETVRNVNQAAKVEEPTSVGPLSFWSGELIVGEGPDRGKIELVGHNGQPSKILKEDTDHKGQYSLTQIGVDKGFFRLFGRGEAPSMNFDDLTVRFSPFYGLSRAVKEGKITPLIAPDIMPPAERIFRKKGQQLEGFVWCLHSYGEQVYGKKLERDDVIRNPNYSRVDLPATPKVNFDRMEVDLTKYGLTVKEKEEKGPEKGQKNGKVEYNTPVGRFLKVYSFGNYSIDHNGFNNGGMRHDTIQLPSGEWIRGFPGPVTLCEVLNVDGKTFLITEHQVLEWLGNDKVAVVATVENSGTISTIRKLISDRYLEIHKSSESDFAGMMEYSNGQWKFYSYGGDYTGWVESSAGNSSGMTLCLFGGRKIRFDEQLKKFFDL